MTDFIVGSACIAWALVGGAAWARAEWQERRSRKITRADIRYMERAAETYQ